MGQLDPTRDQTQPATQLTRLKMTHFDPRLVWPTNPIDPTQTQPDPPVLPHLALGLLDLVRVYFSHTLFYFVFSSLADGYFYF